MKLFSIFMVFYFHLTGGQYLIAGGFGDGASNEMTEVIELVKTNSTPSFGQLPSIRRGAVGTMFGKAPMLCGGYVGAEPYYFVSCISFQNSQWSQSHSMKEKRRYAAGVKINSTTFWILGGFYFNGSNFHLDSTEFIIQGQTNEVPGAKLPYPLDAMCAVKLSEQEIFVIGGRNKNVYTNHVWIYDPQNGFARNQGPSLNIGRDSHSCSIMRDGDKTSIIVAGGWDGDQQLHYVEIYDPTDNTWRLGKKKS